LLVVHELRRVEAQRETAFDVGFLRQQHAAHVAVLDDLHRRLRRVPGGRGTALRPLTRIGQRMQIAGVAQHDRT
jgi:hypothetical protein